jgi:hypothetical protein
MERPIIMTGESVRAILDGRKTQTRRVIKPQPPEPFLGAVEGVFDRDIFEFIYSLEPQIKYFPKPEPRRRVACLYGKVGDRLWLREKYAIKPGTTDCVWYASDFEDCAAAGESMGIKWRPSIFMPRKFSRILLEVVSVRVERVQDISEEDASAEGIEWDVWDQAAVTRDYSGPDQWFQMWSSDIEGYVPLDQLARASYQTLWDSINAKRGYSWELNPWVWVIEFCKVKEGEG